jgi:hypothetical protein
MAKKPLIEIVIHCWRYSRVLNYQLSSLVLHTPEKVDVNITVWHTPSDGPTVDCLAFFAPRLSAAGVRLKRRTQPLSELVNRNIGRNASALTTRADYVWFADADYCFGPGCLDAVRQFPESAVICYPQTVRRHKAIIDGDGMADLAPEPEVLDVNYSAYVPDGSFYGTQVVRKAIGGLQIVRGDTAREKGYCGNNPKMLKPVEDEKWRYNTVGDVRYRKMLGAGGGTAIDIPNVFRIRQSEPGNVDTRE